jgi:hypothetical protein
MLEKKLFIILNKCKNIYIKFIYNHIFKERFGWNFNKFAGNFI